MVQKIVEKEFKESNFLVTGGSGFLGNFVVTRLIKEGVPRDKIFIPRKKDYNLKNMGDIDKIFNNFPADIIIHLAATVGGIGYNLDHPAELIYDNLLMGLNLIECARKNNVKKIVLIGTVCAYPKFSEIPFKEEDIWKGYPEETNAPYGIAKKTIMELGKAYATQYNMNIISLIPVNLYGSLDNFEEKSSHVIPALIKKFIDAKESGKNSVDIWGSGSASREFLYVEDAAEGIVLAAKRYNLPEPINLGSGKEITIKELAEKIASFTEFKGKIIWDKSKPDGQPRRCLDISKAKDLFGFVAKTDFDEGLKETIKWYTESNR